MGNYLSTEPITRQLEEPSTANEADPGSTQLAGKRRKRKDSEQEREDVEEVSIKRKHLQSTSTYIYETLYKQGTGSDVTIIALGKEWKVHKIYLCQAGYFSSMFSGRWKESGESVINVDIPDPNATVEGLDLVFGSLYRDDVTLDKSHMLSTVALCTMLQLDGLLIVCQEFMKETLSSDSVIDYLHISTVYSLTEVREECLFWLSLHLLTSYSVDLLRKIRLQTIVDILPSPDLFVMQVEMDLYTLAKKWLFLKLNDTWNDSLTKLTSATEEYFRSQFESKGVAFLETDVGVAYTPVFRTLRLRNILTDNASLCILESDGIVPRDWLMPLYREQWLKMISTEQRIDAGPHIQTDEEFNRHAVRCGRVLTTPNDYCWRWTGYSFGVDILLMYSSGLMSVKRNTHSQPCMSSVSLHTSRQIALRLRVVSFDPEESETFVASSQDTGVVRLSLGQDEARHLLTLHKDAHFPLYISFSYSLVSVSETPPTNESSAIN